MRQIEPRTPALGLFLLEASFGRQEDGWNLKRSDIVIESAQVLGSPYEV